MQKNFTLEQTRRALIFVKPVVKDIQTEAVRLRKLRTIGSYEESTMQNQLTRIESLLEELQLVGCFCRNLEKGIIDFPSKHCNDDIYYSWSPEESTLHWRLTNEAYECRRSLEEESIESNGTIDPATSIH
jgi:hypothetical protein